VRVSSKIELLPSYRSISAPASPGSPSSTPLPFRSLKTLPESVPVVGQDVIVGVAVLVGVAVGAGGGTYATVSAAPLISVLSVTNVSIDAPVDRSARRMPCESIQ